MKINIIRFGKIKDPNILNLYQYYMKLTSKYLRIEEIVLCDVKDRKINKTNFEKFKISGEIILLSERGKLYDTNSFALVLKNANNNLKQLNFVVGNAFGFEKDLLNYYRSISLSPMTFPHEIALILLIEQIYRGMNINAHGKYHK